METGCHSLHRLKHRAVIALIIVFSLLFYVICIYTHYYHRMLETVGALRNLEQDVQQVALYQLFTGSITIEDGKYVLMKNGYHYSGQYFLFFDSFTICISIVYLTAMIIFFRIYTIFVKIKINRVENELDYLKTETEHFLFGSAIVRNGDYKECNYLLDRLEQRVEDISVFNRKELNRMLTFHQNIIHQINTPLNTIKILIEHLYDDGKIEKFYLDNMNYAIEKASDLTRIYLRLSKLDIGKVKYHFEKIELFDLIEEVYYSLKIYANYYHVTLVNKCDSSIVYADSVWIKEAIENIVKNFIENVVRSKTIVITSATFKDETIIYIDDNGNDSIDIENISFERFESSQSGIGIGLHLCKQIIEMHLGEIIVKNNSFGGVRFIIKLPNQPRKKKVRMEEKDESYCRD